MIIHGIFYMAGRISNDLSWNIYMAGRVSDGHSWYILNDC